MSFRKFFRFVILSVVLAAVSVGTEDVQASEASSGFAVPSEKVHKYEGVAVKEDERNLAVLGKPNPHPPCASCASSTPFQPKPKPCPCQPLPKSFCDCPSVPIYRFYNKLGQDHIYTTEWENKKHLVEHIVYEGVAGRCFPNAEDGTVPMFVYYNCETIDHFYTTNWNELEGGALGYAYKGILCYISPVARKGTFAFLRYWSAKRTDHFYTTDRTELWGGNKYWNSETIPGWICPRKAGDTPIVPCEVGYAPSNASDHDEQAAPLYPDNDKLVNLKL